MIVIPGINGTIGSGEGGVTGIEYGVSFGGDETFLKLGSSDGCTLCE